MPHTRLLASAPSALRLGSSLSEAMCGQALLIRAWCPDNARLIRNCCIGVGCWWGLAASAIEVDEELAASAMEACCRSALVAGSANRHLFLDYCRRFLAVCSARRFFCCWHHPVEVCCRLKFSWRWQHPVVLPMESFLVVARVTACRLRCST